ncbi:formate dehydrogenase accessory sulfurtransferase FdhD [Desulfothermobacter acidiphilus]|uniref:formate dehydrogenase accessory sulfurtransferase FdhD n=1 Tax=Desulfothermobacter acidiphilus TaxID=1938353 RepID=UPI003F88BB6D
MLVHWEILRYCQGKRQETADTVVEERAFNLLLNGQFLATFHCLPMELEYLAMGYLWHAGKLCHPGEIARIERLPGELRVSCRPAVALQPFAPALPPRFRPEQIFLLVDYLDEEPLFSGTGGVHVGLWARAEEMLFRTSDTARHNVLDKLTGCALARALSPSGLALGFSGRLSYSIMAKVARLGVKLVVSPSAPTLAGLELALEQGITVVGFVRRDRFNVYTYPERIEFSAT